MTNDLITRLADALQDQLRELWQAEQYAQDDWRQEDDPELKERFRVELIYLKDRIVQVEKLIEEARAS